MERQMSTPKIIFYSFIHVLIIISFFLSFDFLNFFKIFYFFGGNFKQKFTFFIFSPTKKKTKIGKIPSQLFTLPKPKVK